MFSLDGDLTELYDQIETKQKSYELNNNIIFPIYFEIKYVFNEPS